METNTSETSPTPREEHFEMEDLRVGLRQGRHEDFATLIDRLAPRLAAFIHSFSAGAVDIDEVVQATFVRLFERRSSLRESGSLIGLCFRIARNIALDNLRHQQARGRYESKASNMRKPKNQASPDEVAVASELWSNVLELEQEAREILVARFQVGLSVKETALLLDLPEGTVKTRTRNSLARLKARLSERDSRLVAAGTPALEASLFQSGATFNLALASALLPNAALASLKSTTIAALPAVSSTSILVPLAGVLIAIALIAGVFAVGASDNDDATSGDAGELSVRDDPISSRGDQSSHTSIVDQYANDGNASRLETADAATNDGASADDSVLKLDDPINFTLRVHLTEALARRYPVRKAELEVYRLVPYGGNQPEHALHGYRTRDEDTQKHVFEWLPTNGANQSALQVAKAQLSFHKDLSADVTFPLQFYSDHQTALAIALTPEGGDHRWNNEAALIVSRAQRASAYFDLSDSDDKNQHILRFSTTPKIHKAATYEVPWNQTESESESGGAEKKFGLGGGFATIGPDGIVRAPLDMRDIEFILNRNSEAKATLKLRYDNFLEHQTKIVLRELTGSSSEQGNFVLDPGLEVYVTVKTPAGSSMPILNRYRRPHNPEASSHRVRNADQLPGEGGVLKIGGLRAGEWIIHSIAYGLGDRETRVVLSTNNSPLSVNFEFHQPRTLQGTITLGGEAPFAAGRNGRQSGGLPNEFRPLDRIQQWTLDAAEDYRGRAELPDETKLLARVSLSGSNDLVLIPSGHPILSGWPGGRRPLERYAELLRYLPGADYSPESCGFTLSPIQPGTYVPLIRLNGYIERGNTVVIPTAGKVSDYIHDLSVGCVVIGQATAPDGGAYAENKVLAVRLGVGEEREMMTWETITDRTGNFRFAGLPFGEYMLIGIVEGEQALFSESLRNDRAFALAKRDDVLRQDLDMSKPMGSTLKGSLNVMRGSDRGYWEALLLWRKDAPGFAIQDIERRGNSFEIKNIPPGEYTLIAATDDRQMPLIIEDTVDLRADAVLSVTFQGHTLSGKVDLPPNADDVELYLQQDRETLGLVFPATLSGIEIPRSYHVKADGSFDCGVIPEGSYRIDVLGKGIAPISQKLKLNQDTKLSLEASSDAGSLRITVGEVKLGKKESELRDTVVVTLLDQAGKVVFLGRPPRLRARSGDSEELPSLVPDSYTLVLNGLLTGHLRTMVELSAGKTSELTVDLRAGNLVLLRAKNVNLPELDLRLSTVSVERSDGVSLLREDLATATPYMIFRATTWSSAGMIPVPGLSPGDYVLTVHISGYESTVVNVSVRDSDEAQVQEILLVPR